MDDLISRQAAIDALEKVAELFPWRVPGNRDSYDRYNEAWNDAIGRAEIEIEKLPSAQQERKKGKWLPDNNNYYEERFICSVCGKSYKVDTCMGKPIWDLCPNCGAHMRGESDG